MKQKRMLLVALNGYPDQVVEDKKTVAALSHCSWFTHVVLRLPTWQDAPDALQWPLVRRAMANIRKSRKILVLGRNLTGGWPKRQKPKIAPGDLVDADFYKKAVWRLQAEADSLGCECFLETEPYGKSTNVMSRFLRREIRFPNYAKVRAAIHRAVAKAVAATGGVNYVMPSSSYYPNAYQWLFSNLGKWKVTESTYWLNNASEMPDVRPPRGVDFTLDIGGTACALDGHGLYHTVEEVKALAKDWKKTLVNYPENQGIIVYAARVGLGKLIRSKKWDKR